MKVALLGLACAAFTFSLVAQEATRGSLADRPKENECSIAGMVVKLAASEPLRKARVQLQSTDDQARSIFTVTDADGRFELKRIDPGRYRLKVSRLGFITQRYGEKKPNDPGAILALRPGQEMKDLLFRLVPFGVIAGRVLDEDAEPLPGLSVRASREIYSEGKRILSADVMGTTNDLGEYRLFGLSPGRYFVSATYPRWSRWGGEEDEEGSESKGYARMYYPGTADAGKATPIVIRAGEEIRSIEIPLSKVPVYRIQGRVFNQITHKPGIRANMFLMPKTNQGEWEAEQQFSVQTPDGSFEITGVLPGSYALTALWRDEAKNYSTRIPIEVGNADVSGLAVTIAPGLNINGQVIWDGKPSLERDELTVTPRPVDFDFMFQGHTQVSQGSSFVLRDLGEGTYQAFVSGQSRDCYVKDIQYGGSSALEEGFTITRGTSATLEIIISSHGARVQGTVTASDALPSTGVWVVLVPDAARRSQYRLYKAQTTDQYGRFDLHGIPPGDYKLFSWEEVESDAWQDPEFLKPFEEKGERVSVRDGDTKTVALVAIKTASGEQQKP